MTLHSRLRYLHGGFSPKENTMGNECVLIQFMKICEIIVSPTSNDCAFQLIERTVLDHPHHTLFIILALANANKDQELLQGKVSKKAGGRLSRGMSQTAAEEVSTSFTDYSYPCWV